MYRLLTICLRILTVFKVSFSVQLGGLKFWIGKKP